MAEPNSIFSDRTRLYVTDNYNSRVLVWTTMPESSSIAANFVLGQPDVNSRTSNNGGISGSTMSYPSGVFQDGNKLSASSLSTPVGVFGSHGKLFVSDQGNNRILGWNALPQSNKATANFVMGQATFGDWKVNPGGLSASGLNRPRGVFADKHHAFVADTLNMRVLLFELP